MERAIVHPTIRKCYITCETRRNMAAKYDKTSKKFAQRGAHIILPKKTIGKKCKIEVEE